MLLLRHTKAFISVWIVLAKILNRRSLMEYLLFFGIVIEINYWS